MPYAIHAQRQYTESADVWQGQITSENENPDKKKKHARRKPKISAISPKEISQLAAKTLANHTPNQNRYQ
jgi:hypothetical protein